MVGLMLALLVKFVIDKLEVDSMVVGRHEVMVFMEKTNRINEKMKCFIFFYYSEGVNFKKQNIYILLRIIMKYELIVITGKFAVF